MIKKTNLSAIILFAIIIFSGCNNVITYIEQQNLLGAEGSKPGFTIIRISPADGERGISIYSNFTVTFSEIINPQTITAGLPGEAMASTIEVSADNFKTSVPMANLVGGLSANIYTLIPAEPLAYNTTYKMKISTAVKSISGSTLAGDYITPAGFTTEARYYRSAKDIREHNPGAASGYYTIYPYNEGESTAVNVYCDMTTDGGGWTRISLRMAYKILGGTMMAVIRATTSGFDSEFRPYTQNPGGHLYYYDIDIPFGYSEFYLSDYLIKANADESQGHLSEIGRNSSPVDWDFSNMTSWGDVCFGSPDQAAPRTGYAANITATISSASGVFSWPQEKSIYVLPEESARFRIAWYEGGGEAEGWFPWWSGYIFVR